MTVELLYAPDCPNVDEARANLHRALVDVGLPPSWTECETSAPDVPVARRGFGSPSVLVNGRDVAGAEPAGAAWCRIYEVAGRRSGAPPTEQIVQALRSAMEQSRPPRWRVGLVLPALGAALVPGLTCPACWPGYAALLSALGLPFIPTAPYLLPLTTGLLLLAVAALAFRAESVVPVAVGLVGSALIVIGKFLVASAPIGYGGAGLLVAASLLTVRGRRPAPAPPACAPIESARLGSAPMSSIQGR
jgi:mercuric ion transport protein